MILSLQNNDFLKKGAKMFLVWKRVAIIFLFVEVLLFSIVYHFGPHGLSMLKELHKSYSQLEVRCTRLNEKIKKIESDIVAWDQSFFLKERVAREQLLMKKPGEKIYFR